jgi:hypothetical protein
MKQSKRYTLAIDLDETFVNSVTDFVHQQQIKNGIINPKNAYLFSRYVIRLRKGVFEFLVKAKEKFNLVIFTAAHRSYANFVYNLLDPNKDIFDKVYARENCTYQDGFLKKDMTTIDKDVTKIILIDNRKHVFMPGQYGLHVRDFEGHDDNEMLNLWCCLNKLYVHTEMHTVIHKISKNHNLHIRNKFLEIKNAVTHPVKRPFSELSTGSSTSLLKDPIAKQPKNNASTLDMILQELESNQLNIDTMTIVKPLIKLATKIPTTIMLGIVSLCLVYV